MHTINLSHENPLIRISLTYIIFFLMLISSIGIGFFLLTEGIMKEIPFFSLVAFEQDTSLINLIIQTLLFNSIFIFLIILANHYQVRTFNFGYLPLFGNVIILGLFAGTNSFSGEISSYSPEGWIVFFQVGFLEFSAYILTCCATVNLKMFHANKWRGEKFEKIRNFKDVRLSKIEWSLLILAIILVFIAAMNEWFFLSR